MNEKTNDMDARFEQFYATNFPRVKNFARLLTKSEEDAEDIDRRRKIHEGSDPSGEKSMEN